MKYKVMTMNKKEEKNILIDNLSEMEFNQIKKDLKWLQMSTLSKDFVVMLRDNIEELLGYIPKVNIRDKYTLDNLNRYMYNVLGSFYALIEYYEHNFKEVFKPIKNEYFDVGVKSQFLNGF